MRTLFEPFRSLKIASELRDAFSTADDVNEALRFLLRLADESAKYSNARNEDHEMSSQRPHAASEDSAHTRYPKNRLRSTGNGSKSAT